MNSVDGDDDLVGLSAPLTVTVLPRPEPPVLGAPDVFTIDERTNLTAGTLIENDLPLLIASMAQNFRVQFIDGFFLAFPPSDFSVIWSMSRIRSQ